MDDVTKAAMMRRLQSVEGHVRGIQRMVEDDKYCIDVIKQVEAVQAALTKINQLILENHLRTCVTTAIRGDDPDRREAVIGEILDVFAVSNKQSCSTGQNGQVAYRPNGDHQIPEGGLSCLTTLL